MARLLPFAVAVALLGCERVDYIELNPSELVFKQANNEKWVEAKCMARTGVRAVKAHASWSVRDPEIAEVSPKGLVTPKKSGVTELIAKYGDVEARAPVNVLFVEKVQVEPQALTLKEGTPAVPLAVKAFAFDGRPLIDRQPTMSSSNKAVAQIVGGNSVLPLDPGTGTITVQVDGAKASVQVTVEADKTKKK